MKRTIVTLTLEEIRMIQLALDQRGDSLSDAKRPTSITTWRSIFAISKTS